MILGIGIDSIEIERFAHWHSYSLKRLSRVFSKEEIDYCLAQQHLSAERFAVRFAAREAFYKALGHITGEQTVPFLILCKTTTIHRYSNGMPELEVDWAPISKTGVPGLSAIKKTHLSLTHTKTTGTALVIIEGRVF